MHPTLAFVRPIRGGGSGGRGIARARQHRRNDEKGDQVLPAAHGERRHTQRIIQETLNMAQTRGYYTGGTIHTVNNQIGHHVRSTRHPRHAVLCTDTLDG
jgi:2-oxoglutarate dehydrogenase E1 component